MARCGGEGLYRDNVDISENNIYIAVLHLGFLNCCWVALFMVTVMVMMMVLMTMLILMITPWLS